MPKRTKVKAPDKVSKIKCSQCPTTNDQEEFVGRMCRSCFNYFILGKPKKGDDQ